jgi:hypothetical protein
MRVVVPYAPGCLHERVVPAIEAQGYVPELIECVNVVGHPQSYPAILRDLLLSGDDFCIIEHDNESRPGCLADLEACPEPWCFYAYDFRVSFEDAVHQPTVNSAPLGVDFAPLGHTRFRGGLGQQIESTITSEFFLATWVSRDTFVAGALTALGFQAHRHAGKVFHHHPYPASGAWAHPENMRAR